MRALILVAAAALATIGLTACDDRDKFDNQTVMVDNAAAKPVLKPQALLGDPLYTASDATCVEGTTCQVPITLMQRQALGHTVTLSAVGGTASPPFNGSADATFGTVYFPKSDKPGTVRNIEITAVKDDVAENETMELEIQPAGGRFILTLRDYQLPVAQE